MLTRLRWPGRVLVLAGVLLFVAVVTRSDAAGADVKTPAVTTPPGSQTQPVARVTRQDQAPPDALIVTGSPGNILVEALVGEIHKLNPLLTTYNPVDRDITALIFEGLTASNEYGEIVPDLAESWTVSTDRREYIFVLRDDVLWQDGVPFTAQDVTHTINMISDPLFPGAASLYEFWRTVEVDALAGDMVRFRLTQPLASFPDQLRLGLLPAHVFAGMPVDQLEQHPFNLAPIGTGPYQMETLTASNGQIDGVQLRVAPVYRQRPEGQDGYLLDRIVFRAFPTAEAALDAYRRGEVNSISVVLPGQQSAVQQVPGLSLYTAIKPHVGVLIYNWERETIRFVRNPRARIALAHAVDRTRLVTQHLAGQAVPADSPLLPGSWAYMPDSPWPAYDLAEARAMLEMAALTFEETPPDASLAEETTAEPETAGDDASGETPDAAADGPAAEEGTPEEGASDEAEADAAPAPMRRDWTILTLDDPAVSALARDIAAGWAQLDFFVTVDVVDAPTLRTRLEAGDFDAALIELSFEPGADPDPYVFWHQGQYGPGQNYGAMNDRRISEALEQARRDPNGLNRVEYYRRFQELFAERVPALVLYYPVYMYAADARLEGIQIGFLSSPSDRFRNIQDWAFAG